MRVDLEKDAFRKDSPPPEESKTKVQQRRYYHKEEPKEESFKRPEESFRQDVPDQESIAPDPYHSAESSEAIEAADVFEEPKIPEKSPLQEHSVRSAPRAEIKEVSGDVKKKQKKRIYHEEKKKQKARLHFEDEPGLSSSGEVVTPIMGAAGRRISGAVHRKVDENEDENTAVEAAHRSEETVEASVGKLRTEIKGHRTSDKNSGSRFIVEKSDTEHPSKLQFGSEAKKKTDAKAAIASHEFQKKRYKKAYASIKRRRIFRRNVAEDVAYRAHKAKKREARVARTIGFFRRHKILGLVCLGFVMGLIMIIAIGGAGGTMIAGTGATVMQSTYLAADDEIYAAEDYYSALEDALQAQIDNVRQTYPGYDEYNFQIDEISHNPYQLTSYLTVKFGNYNAYDVESDLTEVFQEQYHMQVEGSTQTVTDTRTVRVGEALGSVVTSGYCNCPICCGRWSGGPTASGAMPQADHTIAVDAQNPIVPIGTKIVMNGVEYTVEDTGNFARYGVAFDVYYDNHSEASAHGHQTWEAYIADDNGSQTVEVTQTRTVKVLNITLTNNGFDTVARNRLDSTEAVNWYNILNTSYGNRAYLWDVETVGGYQPGGMSYEIPPEALSDVKFRNMITEAEKYLGYPYVWGGTSPDTSFDCSGFVCWVINNCGNGWNYGRLTAEGLREICTYVTPDQAKPGDLIFFQGTYNTAGASHVGIYVGNGMMIHCGDPIQYTSIETSYWQQHFYCFGRLP